MCHSFGGLIPVINNERVKGYIQESIRLQINGTREQRIISMYFFIISTKISGTTHTAAQIREGIDPQLNSGVYSGSIISIINSERNVYTMVC